MLITTSPTQQATTATLVKMEGDEILEESELALELVEVGDILKVVPGATVPTDGVLVKGQSFVNEAMITGEAIPAEKVSTSPPIISALLATQPLTIVFPSRLCDNRRSVPS
jgi:Cu+-exporting ATPase